MVTGSPCPAGRYCPPGIPVPELCPLGTWSNSTGLARADECQPCPGGFFCDTAGLTEPTGPCDPGYSCSLNATTATPTDGVTGDICTIGHFCPGGTATPLPCADGSYSPETLAFVCMVCPEGHHCLDGITPVDCPAGFVCGEGTGVVWQSCPTGTFSVSTGLWNETQCTPCSAGSFCSVLNGTVVSGSCNAGYFCEEGSDTATPESGFKGTAGPCPAGSYCLANSGSPTPCPSGTYSNTTHLTQASDCIPCPPGMYCETPGLTEPSGECWEGFYCFGGAVLPNNPTEDITGGPCPAGHFCPNNTGIPIVCPAGSYNILTGQATCIMCPAEYYCPENTTDYNLNPCPVGHICPPGTATDTEYPCPKGYYKGVTGGSSEADCTPCDPGWYCATSGLSTPTAQCDAGWYCARAAWSPKPTDLNNATSADECFCSGANMTGGKCQNGEFCPAGSGAPTSCTGGSYCDVPELAAVTAPCAAGYYCTLGASMADPLDGVTGNLCPMGHFCPLGTQVPEPCPPGTFSNGTGNMADTDCRLCVEGKIYRTLLYLSLEATQNW